MAPTTNSETEEEVAAELEDLIQEDPLVKLVGDHPKTRMLISLLDAAGGLNKSSLAESANVDRTTVYRHLDDLLATGIVVEDEAASEQAGQTTIYTIADHTDEQRVEWLGKLRDFTAKHLREQSSE